MAEVTYLRVGEDMPDPGTEGRWVTIDASEDGLFYGTGCSRTSSGEFVGYMSMAEDDTSLERAIRAAQVWADRYGVPRIWVLLNT
jgi:hypothetical protein